MFALDLRGFGTSDLTRGDCDLQQMANDVIGVRVEEVSASTGGVSSQKSPLLSSLTSPLQQPESESASVSAHKSAERRRFTAHPP